MTVDGHDHDDLRDAYSGAADGPTAVVAVV